MTFFSGIIACFLASLIVSPLIIRGVTFLLRKYRLLDHPEKYKTEKGRPPAPYGIGVSLFLILGVFIPAVLTLFDFSPILEKRLLIMLIIGGCITLVSFIDDMDTIGHSPIRVPPLFRLFMQIGVGAIIGLTSIKIAYMSNIFGGIIALDEWYNIVKIGNVSVTIYWIPILVTIFWYVLVFNAVNFSDGVPGLTGGFALISFIILAGLALKLMWTDISLASQENSQFLLIILAIIIPATFFLTRLDVSRRGIMGDSGTIMLGFLIATLAIIAGGKIATAMSVLGIYLIDLVYVVTVRILKGQNPMRGDQSHHLHYRLMELGFSRGAIRRIIYALTAFFGITAIFLDTRGKIALFIFMTIITVFLTEILTVVKKK